MKQKALQVMTTAAFLLAVVSLVTQSDPALVCAAVLMAGCVVLSFLKKRQDPS